MTAYNLSSLNVLIVDDNKHMQLLLKEVLRALGIRTVHTADDGADAFKEMKVFAADLVICDWNMQPVDGLDFVRLVRSASDSANPLIPIIMLTGHTEANRVLEARDSGITEFLAKPISASSLYQRITTIIERPRAFVHSKTYSGPDRRRRASPSYKGPERRGAKPKKAAPPPAAPAADDGEKELSQEEVEALFN